MAVLTLFDLSSGEKVGGGAFHPGKSAAPHLVLLKSLTRNIRRLMEQAQRDLPTITSISMNISPQCLLHIVQRHVW